MGRVVFVETLDNRGETVMRDRIESLPFTIGRSLDNAIIIDDPWVSARHAEVSLAENGDPLIRDLDSVNGVFAGLSDERLDSSAIGASSEFRIGRTTIRFRFPGEDLPPTRVPSATVEFAKYWLRHPGFLFICLGAITATSLNLTHTRTWIEMPPSRYFIQLLNAYLAIALVASVGGFVSQQVRREFRFKTHLAIAGLIYLAFHAIRVGSEFAGFLGVSPPEMYVLRPLTLFLALSSGLFVSFRVAEASRPLVRTIAAGLIAAGIIGVFFVDDRALGESNWTVYLPASVTLLPVNPDWLPTQDADSFFLGARELEKKFSIPITED
jgi:hypothetical protein